MNYNLKAKNKKTGEIVEVEAIDNYFGINTSGYLVKGDRDMWTEIDFWREYERVIRTEEQVYAVIDDTPIEKGWREKLDHDFTMFYYKMRTILNGVTGDEIRNWWLNECDKLEQQAYARGQEEAYRRSASVARGVECPEPQEYEPELLDMCYQTGEQIALAIEQLASNTQ